MEANLTSALLHKPKKTYSTLLTSYLIRNLALTGMQRLLTNGAWKTNCGVLRNVSRNSIKKWVTAVMKSYIYKLWLWHVGKDGTVVKTWCGFQFQRLRLCRMMAGAFRSFSAVGSWEKMASMCRKPMISQTAGSGWDGLFEMDRSHRGHASCCRFWSS